MDDDPGADAEREGERLVAFDARLRLLLLHLAGSAVRARVGVDDLVQEVYLRALKTGSLPPEDIELFRYLQRVARNCVVDAVRAIRARKRSGPEVRLGHGDWSQYGVGVGAGIAARDLVADTFGPATRAACAEEGQRLQEAFASLAPDHRRVLGLRQFEGLSARDAARRMGRSETAVHSLYRRALMAWEAACRHLG